MNPEVDYEGNEYWWYLFFWGKNTDAKNTRIKKCIQKLTEAIGTLYPELEESYYAFMSDVERSLQTRYSQEDAVWMPPLSFFTKNITATRESVLMIFS